MLTFRSFFALTAALALFVAMPGRAAELTGTARVVDGDTLKMGVVSVRLHGIDAPEMAQTCRRGDGRAWDCGQAASDALTRMAGGRRVSCAPVDVDSYGRIVARCRAGEHDDLGRALVRRGAAFAYARYSAAYVGDEARARAAGRGVWSGTARRPEAFRRAGDGMPTDSATSPSEGCRIKGNISRRGRIFHRPGDPSYERTRIDTAGGERWFCSTAEARAAGWRAPAS